MVVKPLIHQTPAKVLITSVESGRIPEEWTLVTFSFENVNPDCQNLYQTFLNGDWRVKFSNCRSYGWPMH